MAQTALHPTVRGPTFIRLLARLAEVDVAASGRVRAAAGLASDHYAAVIANPPFFTAAQGTLAPEAGRAGARHMPVDALDRWVKTAAGSAAADGEVIFVLPADSLAAAVGAFTQRFGAIAILPFPPRPGGDASRILVRGIKGSRAPLTLLATRAVHVSEGAAFSPEIEAALQGETRLVW